MDISMTKEDRIKTRAYELFQSQGGKQGKELDHWLQAEKEILQEKKHDTKGNNVRKPPQSRNNFFN